MKQENVFTALVLTGLVSTLATMTFMAYQQDKAVEAVNAAWRQAAAPVFKARSVPNLVSNASPADLTTALDAESVLTRAETYKWQNDWPGKNGPTKLIIASADQEWIRLQ